MLTAGHQGKPEALTWHHQCGTHCASKYWHKLAPKVTIGMPAAQENGTNFTLGLFKDKVWHMSGHHCT